MQSRLLCCWKRVFAMTSSYLSAFALIHSVLQGQTCLLLQVSLVLFSSPLLSTPEARIKAEQIEYFLTCGIKSGAQRQGFRVAHWVQNPTAIQEAQETQVQSLGWEATLEEDMATHSSIIAWRIPWRKKSDKLQSMMSHRVGQD